jgi:hypothetical protein
MSYVKEITANYTVLPRQRDILVVCNAADLTVTLPKSNNDTKGNIVTVVTGVASGGTGNQVDPNGSEIIAGLGITEAAGKSYINTGATDAVGDTAILKADGDGKWWVVSQRGTWARQA